MSRHTPGPWSARPVDELDFRAPDHDDFCIVAENGLCPGIVWQYMDEGRANAALIAAAPDLLALAKQYAGDCVSCHGGGGYYGAMSGTWYPCSACSNIRAVIDKAEGRA